MIPEKLKIGDEIRIIAPSRSMKILDIQRTEVAKKNLENLEFKVTFSKYVNESDDYKCPPIEKRLEDLHAAFEDKNVKAILTVIGGYNSNQLLKYINYDLIKENPKIFCGYSDITALSNAIYAKTGLVTYSGPHYSSFGMEKGFEYTLEYFKKMLMEDKKVEIQSSKAWSNDAWWKNQENRIFIKNDGMFAINEGKTSGEIIGGNLCTLNLLQGTEYMPNLENKILFLEEDDLAGNKFQLEFDRNLQSLLHLPNANKIKGIVLGRAEATCEMTKEKWTRIIKSKKELENIPVIGGCDFGHTTPTITFPIGGRASMEIMGDITHLTING
ncbi:MAG: LD-carboxypeptidase [Oscillospiraceae bacterium]|nr:LD-carboxypeptidase [Oscillospiraceae bacterium]